MKENTKLNSKIAEIRKLLKLENSFFINFQLKDMEKLTEGVRHGKGFKLHKVYPHPSKSNFFILEIKSLNSGNYGLDFGCLNMYFSINNQINVSPNIKEEDGLTIPEFETKYKLKFSHPKE